MQKKKNLPKAPTIEDEKKVLQINPSTVTQIGKGLFTKGDRNKIIFQKGEVIAKYDGETLTIDQLDKRYPGTNRVVVYAIVDSDNKYIDASKVQNDESGWFAKHANHCTPNLDRFSVSQLEPGCEKNNAHFEEYDDENQKKSGTYLVALRDIKGQEEIWAYYGDVYFKQPKEDLPLSAKQNEEYKKRKTKESKQKYITRVKAASRSAHYKNSIVMELIKKLLMKDYIENEVSSFKRPSWIAEQVRSKMEIALGKRVMNPEKEVRKALDAFTRSELDGDKEEDEFENKRLVKGASVDEDKEDPENDSEEAKEKKKRTPLVYRLKPISYTTFKYMFAIPGRLDEPRTVEEIVRDIRLNAKENKQQDVPISVERDVETILEYFPDIYTGSTQSANSQSVYYYKFDLDSTDKKKKAYDTLSLMVSESPDYKSERVIEELKKARKKVSGLPAAATESKVESKVKPKDKPKKKTKTKKAKAKGKAKVKATAKQKADAESQAKANAEAKATTEAKAVAEAEAKAEAEVNAQVEAQAAVEAKAASDAKARTEDLILEKIKNIMTEKNQERLTANFIVSALDTRNGLKISEANAISLMHRSPIFESEKNKNNIDEYWIKSQLSMNAEETRITNLLTRKPFMKLLELIPENYTQADRYAVQKLLETKFVYDETDKTYTFHISSSDDEEKAIFESKQSNPVLLKAIINILLNNVLMGVNTMAINLQMDAADILNELKHPSNKEFLNKGQFWILEPEARQKILTDRIVTILTNEGEKTVNEIKKSLGNKIKEEEIEHVLFQNDKFQKNDSNGKWDLYSEFANSLLSVPENASESGRIPDGPQSPLPSASDGALPKGGSSHSNPNSIKSQIIHYLSKKNLPFQKRSFDDIYRYVFFKIPNPDSNLKQSIMVTLQSREFFQTANKWFYQP